MRAILIRHAQASFGAADYDCLSPLGERQAELLGLWVAAHPEWNLRRIVRGAQKRHQQTLDAIYRACAAAGRPLPESQIDADWNEFDHVTLFQGYARRFADDPRLQLLRSEPAAPSVHRLIFDMLAAWSRGDLDEAMPETWQAFSARSHRAFDALDGGHGQTLVVSSGGVISRCAQAALGVDVTRTIALNLTLANSAISDFRRRDAGWDLVSWNTLPHLAAAEHLPLTSHY